MRTCQKRFLNANAAVILKYRPFSILTALAAGCTSCAKKIKGYLLLKLRDIIVSLSLANICFIQRWAELLYHDPYYTKYDPRQGFAALIICVLATGTLFYAASLGLRKTRSPYLKTVGRCFVIGTLIFPLNFLRRNYAIGVSNIYGAVAEYLGSTSAKVVFVIFGLSIFILILKFSRPV